jgi:hypothetical protein
VSRIIVCSGDSSRSTCSFYHFGAGSSWGEHLAGHRPRADLTAARHLALFTSGHRARRGAPPSTCPSGSSGSPGWSHALGQPPRALLLWTAGATGNGFDHARGVSDGPGASRALAVASQNGVRTSNASRRLAARALSIVDWGEVLLAEADLTAWDASGLTLGWSANDPSPTPIHFVAIGGAEVSARVVAWSLANVTTRSYD